MKIWEIFKKNVGEFLKILLILIDSLSTQTPCIFTVSLNHSNLPVIYYRFVF